MNANANARARALTIDDLASGELVPPATLTEARAHRDALALLLAREREASADFLLALADFDRRRGWERLGHASLFSFLHRELGLSKGAAYLRFTAARLLPCHPEVEEALRSGRLCLSAVGELARVLTPENEANVLPRFLGCSSREAREVAAALHPDPSPPRRALVTAVPVAASAFAAMTGALPPPAPSVRAHELTLTQPGRGSPTQTPPPARAIPPGRGETEPLTADLRRLHVTVSAAFLEKVAAARDGLSHTLPGATTEQVLEAALDLLLEKQARAKALVKRPRTKPTNAPPAKPGPNPRSIPAAVEREVRQRDGDRCQFPLDAGGVCGSTLRVQLDHLVPVALGGRSTAANLRCACAFHNRAAAEAVLGEPVMAAARSRAARGAPG
jgi:hypothetical protein